MLPTQESPVLVDNAKPTFSLIIILCISKYTHEIKGNEIYKYIWMSQTPYISKFFRGPFLAHLS
jgi:hypothetical protein